MYKFINKYKRIPIQIRASFWFLVCVFFQQGISVISTPIFTRIMSTNDYGQFSVFNSWLSIISVLVSMNLAAGVYTRGLVKFEKERDVFSSALQGLNLTLVLLWTVVYIIFHDFWNSILNLTIVQMLAMLVIIWTSTVFNFWSIEQRVDFKYQKLVIVTIVVSLVKPALGVFLVLNANDKVTARILGIALVQLIMYTGFFFIQTKRGKTLFSKKYWRHAFLFNLPLIPHYISQSVLSGADRIMIDKMVGSTEAGIYNLGYSVSLIMVLFNSALLQTIDPWLYRKINAKKFDDISNVAFPSFILVACVNIILIAFTPEIISFFAPVQYYEAIWVIPPIAMSIFFMFLYTFFAVFEFYFEKTKFIMVASVGGAILNIILNYIFIDIFGYYAAGYTTLFCYMISSTGHFIFMRKICKDYLNDVKVYNARILLEISVIFLLVGFIFLFSYRNYFIRYTLISVLGMIILSKRKKLVIILNSLLNIKKNGND